jgi:hypothetical protein
VEIEGLIRKSNEHNELEEDKTLKKLESEKAEKEKAADEQ